MAISFDGTRGRPQLRDQVAAHIRELIITGQTEPSEPIRLGPLAEKLSMSLTPVREALLLLTQIGWVTQEANKGFRVAPFDRSDVEDSYLVNAFLSGELARRAATQIDEATIAELHQLNTQIQTAHDSDAPAVAQWNFELHTLIYRAANSPRLISFVDSASGFVPRHLWGSIPGWMDHNRNGHTAIIEALATHNPEQSRALMEHHITTSRDILLNYLADRNFFQNQPTTQPTAATATAQVGYGVPRLGLGLRV